VLEKLSRDAPDTPLIVISGTGRISDTVEALRLGAWDYILKPILRAKQYTFTER
jgi:DNA-binding NtrC family response regulator